MGVIAHESTHAALRWCERMGIDCKQKTTSSDASDGEERFAYALGEVARQIGVRAHHIWNPKKALDKKKRG